MFGFVVGFQCLGDFDFDFGQVLLFLVGEGLEQLIFGVWKNQGNIVICCSGDQVVGFFELDWY